jgi:hypothetical protein
LASPFWRLVYCSKMETKLFSQVLSFSISMCVRQMRPIHFSAIFHWHYLTRTMFFCCRCVLTGVWRKHLSIYRMAQKITWHSFVYLWSQVSKRRWRHLHTYFSTIITETTCSDGQGYRFGVCTNTVSISSRRPPIPPPPPPPPGRPLFRLALHIHYSAQHQ